VNFPTTEDIHRGHALSMCLPALKYNTTLTYHAIALTKIAAPCMSYTQDAIWTSHWHTS